MGLLQPATLPPMDASTSLPSVESPWASLLASLHSVWHFSLSLRPVDPNFDVTVDYLQSLMLIVAMVLAIGFAILLLLALFLCLIISFAPPLLAPPWSYRCTVIFVSGVLVAVTSKSLHGSLSMQRGLHGLTDAMHDLWNLTEQVVSRQDNLTTAAAALDASLTPVTFCIGCDETNSSTPSNVTRELCHLLRAGQRAVADARQMEEAAAAAPAQATQLIHVIHSSTGWQEWAAVLPLFALTCTAAAVMVGALAGRRNLLLLAQFVSVIIWWLMCAVFSVEFAMTVGFADACVSTVNTTLRVLRTEARGGHEEPAPADLWHFNLSAHYLSDCSVPNPLSAPLLVDLADAKAAAESLHELSPSVLHNCTAKELQATIGVLQSSLDFVLAPLGRDADGACGGSGVLTDLFERAADVALCDEVATGFVMLFYYQLVAGGVLLILSLLMPGLWHSHHLRPFSVPTRRDLRTLPRTMRRWCACRIVQRMRRHLRRLGGDEVTVRLTAGAQNSTDAALSAPVLLPLSAETEQSCSSSTDNEQTHRTMGSRSNSVSPVIAPLTISCAPCAASRVPPLANPPAMEAVEPTILGAQSDVREPESCSSHEAL